MVRPDDEPDDKKPPPTTARSRSSRTTSRGPTTRSGPSGSWRPRWPPSSASSSARRRSTTPRTTTRARRSTTSSPTSCSAWRCSILVSSLLRKRLFQGITLALFGSGRLQPPLLGLRRPVPPGRRVVPGARLPPAAGAQAGRGGGGVRADQRQATAHERVHGRAPTSATRRPPETRAVAGRRPPVAERRAVAGPSRRFAASPQQHHDERRATSSRTSRTAGRMKTLADDVLGARRSTTGETSAGSPGTATAWIDGRPGAWKRGAGQRLVVACGRRAGRCRGTSSPAPLLPLPAEQPLAARRR